MEQIAIVVLTALVTVPGTMYVQSRRQKRDEIHWLRGKMLEAFDDFSTDASGVLAQIGGVDAFDMNDIEKAREQIREYKISFNAACARLPRIDLLCGPESAVARAAREELTSLNKVRVAADGVVKAYEQSFPPDAKVATVEAWTKWTSEHSDKQTTVRAVARSALARPEFPKERVAEGADQAVSPGAPAGR